jgi:hypothetical protein
VLAPDIAGVEADEAAGHVDGRVAEDLLEAEQVAGVAPPGSRPNRTSVLARPTGFYRADATNVRIPIEGVGLGLAAEGA